MAEGDIVSLRVVGRYEQQNIVNTLHYQVVSQAEAEQDVLDLLCTIWDGQISGIWVARHSDGYTLVGVKAFNHTGVAKRPGFLAIGDAGTVVANLMLPHTCRTITLYTDSANHRRRGRVMLSGSVDSMFDSTDGSVTAVERIALEVLGDLLMAILSSNGNSFQLCIPPTDVLPEEVITSTRGRVTPSVVTTRRIRQFLIG